MCRCIKQHAILCPTPDRCAPSAGEGVWIRQQAEQHVCKKPVWGSLEAMGARTGDIWKCNVCGTRWQLKVEWDQREDDTWFTWTRKGTHER